MTDIFSVSPSVFLLFFFVYWITQKWIYLNNLILFVFGITIYSWGNVDRGILLIGLTIIEYFVVKFGFQENKTRKIAFAIGLSLILSIWIYYKYFFNQAINNTFSFPIGISFYMLRLISYLFEKFRKPNSINMDFLEFGLYISFFPQLVSGPIEHPIAFVRKIRKKNVIDIQRFINAGKSFLIGLVKKIVIADNLRLIVDRIFQLDLPTVPLLTIGAIGFSIQLFCDFSGYTDLSRGFSTLLGIESEINFNAPFLAKSPRIFWTRWHISFSNWLRLYIFNPLRRFFVKKMKKLPILAELLPPIITMVFSGIWHGNGITFIVWGLFHGLLIFVDRKAHQVQYNLIRIQWISNILNWVSTMLLIMVGWIIFRAPSMDWITRIIHSGWRVTENEVIVALSMLTMIFMYSIPLIIHQILKMGRKFRQFTEPLFFAAAVILLIIFSGSGVQDFIYFEF